MAAIGFIGSGNISGTVARLSVAAGYDVVLSNSRGPETLTDLVEELGKRALGRLPGRAAAAGELVVVSPPTEGPVIMARAKRGAGLRSAMTRTIGTAL